MDNKRKIITGFGRRPSEQQESPSEIKVNEAGAAETKMIDELMASLRQDAMSYEDFERKIVGELKDVKSMENNIMHIQSQIEVMKRLLNTRDGIVKRIIFEGQKIGDTNIPYVETLYDALSKVSAELNSNINLAAEELSKLLLTQKDFLYLEETNRSMMHSISDEATKLRIELKMMSDHQKILHEELVRFSQIIAEKKKQNQM